MRAQFAARADEKQKMLDVLFEVNLMPDYLPRHAGAYPELTGELHNAVIGFLALTPSQLLAINQEDLTKETAQQNLPGTTWQYPNWGRKMRFTVEQLRSDPDARNFTAMCRNWIVRSGRENQLELERGAGLRAKPAPYGVSRCWRCVAAFCCCIRALMLLVHLVGLGFLVRGQSAVELRHGFGANPEHLPFQFAVFRRQAVDLRHVVRLHRRR